VHIALEIESAPRSDGKGGHLQAREEGKKKVVIASLPSGRGGGAGNTAWPRQCARKEAIGARVDLRKVRSGKKDGFTQVPAEREEGGGRLLTAD